MKRLTRGIATAVFTLLCALPAAAQEPVADIVISSMIPYLPEDLSEGNYGAFIEEGIDGAPDEIEMGMIVRLVDDEDSSLTVLAEVTGTVSNDDATISDTKYTVTILSR